MVVVVTTFFCLVVVCEILAALPPFNICCYTQFQCSLRGAPAPPLRQHSRTKSRTQNPPPPMVACAEAKFGVVGCWVVAWGAPLRASTKSRGRARPSCRRRRGWAWVIVDRLCRRAALSPAVAELEDADDTTRASPSWCCCLREMKNEVRVRGFVFQPPDNRRPFV